MGPHETEKLSHAKGHCHSDLEAAYSRKENLFIYLFTNCISKRGLVCKIYKEHKTKLDINKTHNPI